VCWYGQPAGARYLSILADTYHCFAESDDTSGIPESNASDTLETPLLFSRYPLLSAVADIDAHEASDEVVLENIPEAGKQAVHYDTSSESAVAQLEDESADPLDGSFLASCAVHTCFILKCLDVK